MVMMDYRFIQLKTQGERCMSVSICFCQTHFQVIDAVVAVS